MYMHLTFEEKKDTFKCFYVAKYSFLLTCTLNVCTICFFRHILEGNQSVNEAHQIHSNKTILDVQNLLLMSVSFKISLPF